MSRRDTVWHNRTGSYIETTKPTGYDILINGTDRYLNWGVLSGTTGYGIRDNAGVMEFKDSGGAWAAFGVGGGTVDGSGTANEIAYWVDSNTLGTLAVATYPSLAELAYVKGVTSAIQTQINTKANSSGALSQFVGNGNWKVFYSDGSGDITELALGADGTFLKSNGASSAPTFAVPAGSGDVTKVGTPANNQIGVWTGDGTIEGDANFYWDSVGKEFSATVSASNYILLGDDYLYFSTLGGGYNFRNGNVGAVLDTTSIASTSKTFTFPNTSGTLALLQASNAYTVGGQSITVADTTNVVGLTVTQNDSTNDPLVASFIATGTYSQNMVKLENQSSSSSGAYLELYHNSTSPSTSDTSGIEFNAKNASGTKITQAAITSGWGTTTAGAEDGQLKFFITAGGGEYTEIFELRSTDARVFKNLVPATLDGAALGTTSLQFSDLFLASGGVINFNNGNATLTHSAGLLTSNVSLSLGTSNILTTGTIELGAASDTTISRVSAGVVAIEGVNILTTTTGLPLAGGTMSGNITLGENTSIALDPAGSADGKYTGITVTGTGGATIAFGDLVTLDKDDSRWELVDISVAAAATGDARGVIGIAVTSSTDGGAITVLLQGIIRADANFPALTIGAAVFASTTGDIVVTQPTTTDHVIRQVGFAMTADEIFFSPTQTWVTHT